MARIGCKRLLAVTVLVAAAIIPTMPGATASPTGNEINAALPRLSVNVNDTLAITLIKFNTWLIDQVHARADGYVASVDYPASGAVTLLWYGAHNSLLDAVLSQAVDIGIIPSVQDWAYSYDQLDRGSQQLMDDTSWYNPSLFDVNMVEGMNQDYQGLTVDGMFADSVISTQRQDLEEQMTLAATALTGMSVQIVADSPGVGVASGRSDPSAPFRGGSYMESGPHVCSTGFTIFDNNATHTITARHCNEPNFVARDNINKTFSGADVVLSSVGGARELGSNGDGTIFTGPQDQDSSDFLPVKPDPVEVSKGDEICTSGGNSGQHCHIVVTDTLSQFDDSMGTLNVVVATLPQPRQTIAVIMGDSGGPVYIPYIDQDRFGLLDALAVGMIQGLVGNQNPNCGNVHDLGDNSCSRTVLFTKMTTILNGFPGSRLSSPLR